MELRKEALDKRPTRAKIYSGEEFIKEIFSIIKGEQKGLWKGSQNQLEEDDFIAQEENYDLYFPNSDVF